MTTLDFIFIGPKGLPHPSGECYVRKAAIWPEKFGQRDVAGMLRQINELRQAIRAEGSPAIQDAWDKVEEHIDFAYRPLP